MNGLKSIGIIDILVCVNTSKAFGLNELTLSVDNGAQIKNIVLDLCVRDLRVISSYKELKIDVEKAKLSVDVKDIASKARYVEASSVKITV